MGTDGIYRAIKAAAEDAGFDSKRVHPHLLRATAITRMCNAGMHPAMVSEITGVSVAVIARHYHNPAPMPSGPEKDPFSHVQSRPSLKYSQMGLDTAVLAGRLAGVDREHSRRLDFSSGRPKATARRVVAGPATNGDSRPYQAS